VCTYVRARVLEWGIRERQGQGGLTGPDPLRGRVGEGVSSPVRVLHRKVSAGKGEHSEQCGCEGEVHLDGDMTDRRKKRRR